MEVARVIYWNISNVWLMYVIFLIALVVFGFGVAQKVGYLRAGKPRSERWSDFAGRAFFALKQTLLQKRVVKDIYPALFHGFIFYSFVMFCLITAAVFIHADFKLPIFRGWVYLILSLGADIASVVFMVGVFMAVWRRYVSRPASHSLSRTWDDALILVLLSVIVLTGILLEALRIRFTGEPMPFFSPVGYGLSYAFRGIDERTGFGIHKALWWFHMLLAMGFIAIIPYTKLLHLVGIPSNEFFGNLSNDPSLRRTDMEAMMSDPDFDESKFTAGFGDSRDFTWKDRLDHLACISCGRCHSVCPATRAEQPFSPMTFIAALRDYGTKVDPSMTPVVEGEEKKEETEPEKEIPPIVDTALPELFVWYCRTCRACVEVCPAAIEHVDQFLEVRRNLVMIRGELPSEARTALKKLQSLGNPFDDQSERTSWMEELGVPVIGEGEKVDVLYWVGCVTSFDPTKHRIAEDLCKLLTQAGVNFGILGDDEHCCGDPARLLADEMVFQEKAKEQLEILKARTFDTLLVSCPHCYHVFANEYKSLGASFKVVHHSELIQELIEKGKLKIKNPIANRVTYHDPCYLGRYQGIYDPPREILDQVLSTPPLEMADSENRSMCCGGGGGHYWMDIKVGKRINTLRVEQADATGCDTIATGCGYCMQMLRDSVALLNLDEKIKVQDIATLTLQSMEEPASTDKAPSESA